MRKKYLILILITAVMMVSTGTAYVENGGERAAFVENGSGDDVTGPEGNGGELDPGEDETDPDGQLGEGSGEDTNGTEPGTGEGLPEVSEPPTETEPTTVPEPEPVKFTITAVGDVVLGRGVSMRLEQQGRSFEYPFEKVRDLLAEGDIVFFNLECPLTDSTHSLDPKGKYILKAPAKYIESIKYAGFTMANLANNHMMDYYEKGLDDTIALLEENNIVYAGAGRNLEEARRPAITEVDGLKVAMLSYTDMAELVFAGDPYFLFAATEDKHGVVPRKLEYVLEDIEKIRDDVDLLIVSLHWGVEETFIILDEMVEFAHTIMDNGVDIILGHHPHQFQGMEIYKNKPIIYSMGNFIFDQNDPENQETFIVNLEYEDTEFIRLRAIPVRTEGKTQVVLHEEEGARNILEREKRLCEELGTGFEIVGETLIYEAK